MLQCNITAQFDMRSSEFPSNGGSAGIAQRRPDLTEFESKKADRSQLFHECSKHLLCGFPLNLVRLGAGQFHDLVRRQGLEAVITPDLAPAACTGEAIA